MSKYILLRNWICGGSEAPSKKSFGGFFDPNLDQSKAVLKESSSASAAMSIFSQETSWFSEKSNVKF